MAELLVEGKFMSKSSPTDCEDLTCVTSVRIVAVIRNVDFMRQVNPG
jgi:hypothetical protein